MKNQKGMTLIEILGTLILTVMAMGLILSLYFSIQSQFNITTANEQVKASARLSIKQIINQVSRASKVCVVTFQGVQELRYQIGNEIKSLVYIKNGQNLKTLRIFKLSISKQDFENVNIHYDISSARSYYQSSILLTDELADIPSYLLTNSNRVVNFSLLFSGYAPGTYATARQNEGNATPYNFKVKLSLI